MNNNNRYVLYLDENLEPGIAINVAAHLAAQFGCHNPDVGGNDVQDSSGNRLNGLPVYPNVILKTRLADLEAVIEKGLRLQADQKIQLLVYPEAGKLTSTDQEYREMIKNQSGSEILMLGCLMFGAKNVINRLSKKAKSAQLWN